MRLPGMDLPLGTIWCIGSNYAEHAREMGVVPPASPTVFLKPASAVLLSGGTLFLPADSRRVDHEVELVVARAKDESLLMAVGVDFTARDIQERDKAKGLPWTSAKGRPGFAALGPFVPAKFPVEFSVSVNGRVRQKGSSVEMIFSVEKILGHLETVYGMGPGDIVYTGTPAGVSPLAPGDRVEAVLGGGVSRLAVAVSHPA
ncbi:MAG: hypothetical protein A2V88_01650 [Elusimicrobia bacterium RBG_16_66_12]|nr:MAG: hypothetical protein A2V88_01650 [Elusimicrobia bacterium RBG_16_66_12]